MNREDRKQQLLRMSREELADLILRLENEAEVLKITKGYDDRDKSRMKDILTSISLILEAYNK